MTEFPAFSRRHIIQGLTLAASFAFAGPAVAARLITTPHQTTGPFYPESLPLDSDNDLVQVQGRTERAQGEVAHIFGRILDQEGRPLNRARVEIWQCDSLGHYHHPRDGGGAVPNFQGFGHTVTGEDGAYRFRTIKPVPYPGRAPHIHFAVSGKAFPRLTTQMYVAGHPLNQRDGILNSVRNTQARENLIVPLGPAPQIEPGTLAGTFDIVL